MEDTLFFITTVHKLSGLEVTENLVSEMVKIYGSNNIKTKTAVATLEALQSASVSPSELVNSTLNNATVYIPSASNPRRKGRSVD